MFPSHCSDAAFAVVLLTTCDTGMDRADADRRADCRTGWDADTGADRCMWRKTDGLVMDCPAAVADPHLA